MTTLSPKPTTTPRPDHHASRDERASGDAPHRKAGDPPSPAVGIGLSILSALASLKLTVTLFAMSIFLVFAGTLAQVDAGIWTVMDRYFRTPIAWIELQALAPANLQWSGSFPFPGGWLLGAAVLVNLLAAHLMRFKMTWKRSGILMIHTGLIVLVLSEFVTGALADEGQMSIVEGGASHVVEDIRETELAVLDRSDPRFDTVVAFPESRLAGARPERTKTVGHASLPFDLRVIRFMANSRLVAASRTPMPNPANRGEGQQVVAEPRPEVAGTSPTQRANESAAYVQLLDKQTGEPIGTYLLALRFALRGMPQVVEHNGTTYHMYLRFKRTYKPYQLELIDFRHDKYIGTDKPKDFASHLQLRDPQRNENREVVIRMNEPLRYRGDAIYQAAFMPDDRGTVLQVVSNPGWTMPYVSCALVTLGLLIHFVMSLTKFVGRQQKHASKTAAQPSSGAGSEAATAEVSGTAEASGDSGGVASPSLASKAKRAKIADWVAIGLALALGIGVIGAGLRPATSGSDFALDRFAQTPVVHGGRIKPIGSLARTSMLIISDKRSFEDAAGEEQSAMVWLLDTLTRLQGNEVSLEHKVFRIDNHEVLGALGLEPRPGDYRYALNEFSEKLPAIRNDVEAALELESDQRSLYQKQLLELNSHVGLYLSLAGWRQPHAIPPTDGSADPEGWRTVVDAAREDGHTAPTEMRNPAAMGYGKVLAAWAKPTKDAAAFNTAVEAYHADLEGWVPKAVRDAKLEHRFHNAELFKRSAALYVLGFLLICAGWLGRWDKLLKGGRWLILFTLIVHTAAIAIRVYLMGRPPVTNLYSSAIFVGWGAGLLGLALEWLYRNGIGAAVAAGVGFLSLVVAVNLELAADGETMEMMQAVLDTNFWLATHVVVITMGYAATFLAGALAIGYILVGLFTRELSRANATLLYRMIYGIVCFALLFSFVGTVLGGIWADQSWGRFWGWDPKENGALIIVLWNALMLHARWGGIVRQRGFAVLAVVGNIVTAWSWFGVNMLGVGLHSYGFMSGAAFWIIAFVASQLVIIALGLAPRSLWRSGG